MCSTIANQFGLKSGEHNLPPELLLIVFALHRFSRLALSRLVAPPSSEGSLLSPLSAADLRRELQPNAEPLWRRQGGGRDRCHGVVQTTTEPLASTRTVKQMPAGSAMPDCQSHRQVLGLASLRLIPKHNGVRPIMNLNFCRSGLALLPLIPSAEAGEDTLGKLAPSTTGTSALRTPSRSANAVLRDLFAVLKMETKRQSWRFGSGVFGMDDI